MNRSLPIRTTKKSKQLTSRSKSSMPLGLGFVVIILYSILWPMFATTFLDDSSVKGIGGPLHLPPHDVNINNDDNNMDTLRSISFPHGSFFFGLDSHQTKIPENDVLDPSASWSSLQRELLDDSDIN